MPPATTKPRTLLDYFAHSSGAKSFQSSSPSSSTSSAPGPARTPRRPASISASSPRDRDRSSPPPDPARAHRRSIATTTLAALSVGSYTLASAPNHPHALPVPSLTLLYHIPPPYAPPVHKKRTRIDVQELTTIQGARLLINEGILGKVALLNFASATKPGGGFLSGAQAQEESIARSSTLSLSLTSPTAGPFYSGHKDMIKKKEKKGWYTHSMIWSEEVVLCRDDEGEWIEPVEVDVLTCAAVNAREVRRHSSSSSVEDDIQAVMRERMYAVLATFVHHAAGNLVLGAFGTGVFANDVRAVAQIWRSLLFDSGPFEGAFDRVVFAVIGRGTYATFKGILA